MGKIKIGKSDVIWSYVGIFFRVATNIILLPLILKFLTNDELGLWYVFASIGQVVTLLDFGFAAALARNISYVWCGASSLSKENVIQISNDSTNWEYFKIVLATCRYIYWSISLVALLILSLIGTPYVFAISGSETFWPWAIYASAVFVNLLYSYYTSFLRGVGAVAENNKAAIYSKISQIILSFILLYMGLGLLGVSIAYLASGFILRLVSKWYFLHYEDIGKSIKNVVVDNVYRKCLDLFKVIWYNASKDGLVTLANYLSTQANTLICSYVIGLAVTGSYGLSIQLATVIGTISTIIFTSFHPAMQEAAVHHDLNKGMRYLSTSIMSFIYMFASFSVLAVITLPILYWIKPDFYVDPLMFSAVLLYFFIYNLYHLFASFISTYNTLPYTRSFVLTSLLTVLSSYLIAVVTDWGVWALVIPPLVVALLYNAWKWPSYVIYDMMKSSIKEFVLDGNKNISYYVKNYISRQ